MNKRKIKKIFSPVLYVSFLIAVFLGIGYANHMMLKPYSDYDYSKSIMKDVTEATLKEEENQKRIIVPYNSQSVEVLTSYYDMNDENERKEKSLIYYENTYMPSTGILYGSSDEFDIVSVSDGKVTKVTNEDILGTMVEVTHNTNLVSYYYSLKNVAVKEGDEIKCGDIIGNATKNKIVTDKNSFLFEVYYQGKAMNPDKFYQMNYDELQ